MEHDLVTELDEMNQKLQEEVNELKSVALVAKFQIEVDINTTLIGRGVIS